MARPLDQGVVDVLGSDHAPYTRDEKVKRYPASPSGMTGVQTPVPLMLDQARFVDLTSAGPNRLFEIARKDRSAIAIVDLNRRETITHGSARAPAGRRTTASRPMPTR